MACQKNHLATLRSNPTSSLPVLDGCLAFQPHPANPTFCEVCRCHRGYHLGAKAKADVVMAQDEHQVLEVEDEEDEVQEIFQVTEKDLPDDVMADELRYMKPFLWSEDKRFQCKICLRCFKTAVKLTSHSRSHVKLREDCLQCYFCNQKFLPEQFKLVFTHIAKVHSFPNPFVCLKCGDRFSQKAELTKHICGSGNSNSINSAASRKADSTSEIIASLQANWSDDQKHFMDQFTPASKRKACKVCLKCVISHYCTKHEEIHDDVPKGLLECCYCRERFPQSDKRALLEHIATKHAEDPKPFECPNKCGYKTKSISIVAVHINGRCPLVGQK
jgi:hypothetical protein